VTSSEYRRLALILGALTAMGPLAIDMYLPALPAIAREFRADAAAVQVSLAVYFAGIAIGQAFYGPMSDAVGRKPALFFGLFVFIASSNRVCLGGQRRRPRRVSILTGSWRLCAARRAARRRP
jgi:DHA1 family bicyclomycin/chloramphenicol resistance-like MFS transporter